MAVALKPDVVLDTRGQLCPAFVLRAREEIDQLESGPATSCWNCATRGAT
jgi:TusA-related sulfurtransferase